jgi:hypothetical protein
MGKMQMGMVWQSGGDPQLMDEAAKQKVEAYVTKRVGDFRCPDHDEPPTIVCSGARLEALRFDVKGCCQKAIYLVQKKLEE